jgi:7,8-dihydroneopterin aldolase/epimerase/oxygenase
MRLFVEGLEVAARIGVHPQEQGRLQPLIFDVEMDIVPPEGDSLSATVDYDAVPAAIDHILGSGHVGLVETLARQVADRLLALDGVSDVCIRIHKPGAIRGARAAGACWTTRG